MKLIRKNMESFVKLVNEQKEIEIGTELVEKKEN